MKSPGLPHRIALAAFSVLGTIFAVEVINAAWTGISALRQDSEPPPHIIEATLPEFFVNNPSSPGIGSHGYRDCSDVPGENGKERTSIYFSGDSVVFGFGVSCEQSFPFRARGILVEEWGLDWDAINAGVGGYNTFNEVRAYQRFAETHPADIVVLTTCLNDFVNPRLHWDSQGLMDLDIPPAAIPNLEYDKRVAIPTYRAWKKESWWRRFVTFRAFQKLFGLFSVTSSPYDQKGYQLNLTGEIDFPITTLLEEDPPELSWYEDLLEELKVTCDKAGTKLVVTLVPLAYQLEPEYPYQPQSLSLIHI